MIPLRDSVRSERFPMVTISIIVLNIIVFIYQETLPYRESIAFVYQYGLVPQFLLMDFRDYWFTFFTSTLLHGSWAHLIGNMWMLWLFGDNVEDQMGRGRFLLFYLSAALVAGLCHCISGPTSNMPVVGASGAVAGVMGAYFVMFRHARILTYIIPVFLVSIPAWFYLGIWALIQVYSALAEVFSGSVGTVALWAHIGGFLVGVFLYRFFLRERWLHDSPGPNP